MFILKKGHQQGVYVPLRALFLVCQVPQERRVWDQFFLSFFFLSIPSRSNFDHHLRCGGWLNFEFS